ncbi:hypothetical protein Lal_00045545 [Lupinus albus]|nr:hypothetical protein Lal_00045545 [Lupinus albus]
MADAENDPPGVANFPPFPSSASPVQAISPLLCLPLPIAKLTEKNYLTWRQFMLAVLNANRVLRFVQNSEIPSHFLSETDRANNHIKLELGRTGLNSVFLAVELNLRDIAVLPPPAGAISTARAGSMRQIYFRRL